MRIGFIGLGKMGRGIAGNLLRAKHDVMVYNRTPGKDQPLVEQGAKTASSIADACRGDAVITMLADDAATEAVVFGERGLLASLAKGAIHIAMSTISVGLSERLAAAHSAEGQGFVAAPVFGRPEAAATAQLFVVVAGAPTTVEACMPLFSAVGQRTFRIADRPPLANLVKLSGNFLLAAAIEALGEAIALVVKAGVDPQKFVEFLTATLFAAPAYKTYGGLIAQKRFEPAGFAASLGAKDIRLALAASEGLRVPMPIASLLRDRFLALLAQGGEAFDWSAIARLTATDAGQR